MDALIFAVALLALAAFVARPLYAGSPSAPGSDAEAAARSDSLVQALDDLEVDRRTGLIDEAEYLRQRAELEAGSGPADGEPGPAGGPSEPVRGD